MTATKEPFGLVGDSATPAINGGTARRRKASATTTTRSSATTPATRRSAVSGSVEDDNAMATSAEASGTQDQTPQFENSTVPSNILNKRWRQPRSLNEFAQQANAVATLVLNGEINMDQARIYSSVARIVAQAMSVEVSRARFARTVPLLDFPEEAAFDEPDE